MCPVRKKEQLTGTEFDMTQIFNIARKKSEHNVYICKVGKKIQLKVWLQYMTNKILIKRNINKWNEVEDKGI